MVNIAYFDCYSGASGDLLLAAVLDKAVCFEWFLKELRKLSIFNDTIEIEKSYVKRNSINSCKINIKINSHDHSHRNYKDICNIIESSQIEEKAKVLSKKIFLNIAKAEATVHNTTIEEIHFHEVGAIDSIIDIVGFSICYSSLNIDKCIVSPLPTGSGTIKCAHGNLPVPAPATLEILKNSILIINNNDKIKEECLTPTGAGILSTIVDECSYISKIDNIENIGYGAGDKTFDKEITSNLRFITASNN
ncbi:MAG: LarC family nickel insertion protein [Vampirovibrionia bacterium]